MTGSVDAATAHRSDCASHVDLKILEGALRYFGVRFNRQFAQDRVEAREVRQDLPSGAGRGASSHRLLYRIGQFLKGLFELGETVSDLLERCLLRDCASRPPSLIGLSFATMSAPRYHDSPETYGWSGYTLHTLHGISAGNSGLSESGQDAVQ